MVRDKRLAIRNRLLKMKGTHPIAGLMLGGGLGILGRKHGLTADHLLGAQVVLADGRILKCNDHQHEELF